MKSSVFVLILLSLTGPLFAQQVDSLQAFKAPLARQAVAVDADFLYAINNTSIEKLDKLNGESIKIWKDTTNALKHLNSGIVLEGKLYCAHSNFPDSPMASSIEVFDPQNLQPLESHSLGIYIGSATWIDWHEGHWYVAFAHYSESGKEPGKNNHWTQLVKFNQQWERVGGWIFPKELLNRFGVMSNSGGFITQEGTVYITGHDNTELYQLEFPTMGYTLKWVNTISAPFEGQGIAQDPKDEKIIYGISRSKGQIIKGRIQE
jgi:hypothetical protein